MVVHLKKPLCLFVGVQGLLVFLLWCLTKHNFAKLLIDREIHNQYLPADDNDDDDDGDCIYHTNLSNLDDNGEPN